MKDLLERLFILKDSVDKAYWTKFKDQIEQVRVFMRAELDKNPKISQDELMALAGAKFSFLNAEAADDISYEIMSESLSEATLKKPLTMYSAAAKGVGFEGRPTEVPAGTKVKAKHFTDTASGEKYILLTTQDGVTFSRIIYLEDKDTYLQESKVKREIEALEKHIVSLERDLEKARYEQDKDEMSAIKYEISGVKADIRSLRRKLKDE